MLQPIACRLLQMEDERDAAARAAAQEPMAGQPFVRSLFKQQAAAQGGMRARVAAQKQAAIKAAASGPSHAELEQRAKVWVCGRGRVCAACPRAPVGLRGSTRHACVWASVRACLPRGSARVHDERCILPCRLGRCELPRQGMSQRSFACMHGRWHACMQHGPAAVWQIVWAAKGIRMTKEALARATSPTAFRHAGRVTMMVLACRRWRSRRRRWPRSARP